MRIAVLMLVMGLATSSQADDAYTWYTDSGTVAYTDDKSRIPARYADESKRVRVKSLYDYDRLTITQTNATPYLIEVPGYETTNAPVQQVLIEVAPGVTIPVRVDSGEPVRVKQGVRQQGDARLYDHTTVTRGDDLLLELSNQLGDEIAGE